MIVLAESGEQKESLFRICGKSAFGCKIASIAMAYGFDRSFSSFWIDTQYDVAFCLMDELMLIAGTVLNPREAVGFLEATGARAVMCAVRNAELLGLKSKQAGDILRKLREPSDRKIVFDHHQNVREICQFLEQNGMIQEFETFYLDLSHKLRHGASVVVTHYEREKLVGCALVSSISEDSAILSVVAVERGWRRQGIGSALIRQAEDLLPCSRIFIFRERNAHKEFYEELGYKKQDTWVSALLQHPERG